MYAAIEENNAIYGQFKELLCEYIDLVLDKYPDMDFRPLYENIKTLQVIEGDQELLHASWSLDSYGCYRRDENIIYVFDYEELDIAYQLQSNYNQVMIDCMDNYDYSDYMQKFI